MRVSRDIGQYKKEHNMPVLQTQRYEELLARRAGQAGQMGMDREFMRTVLGRPSTRSRSASRWRCWGNRFSRVARHERLPASGGLFGFLQASVKAPALLDRKSA